MVADSTVHLARKIGVNMARVRIIEGYRPQYPDPIRFSKGHVVTLGQNDTEWPEFVWVTTSDGNEGWAPHGWLKPSGNGDAEALRDYSAQEVDADESEHAYACYEYGGWCWIITDRDTFGWIPSSHLELLPEPEHVEPSVEELAEGWIQYWSHGAHNDKAASEPYAAAEIDIHYLHESDPEKSWAVIQAIYPRPDAEMHLGVLAAGPLEDLLGSYGPSLIDRVEALAKQDHRFARLLRGVWQYTMPDDIWTRVRAAMAPTD